MKNKTRLFYNIFCHGIMLLMAFISLFPIYIMVMGRERQPLQLALPSVQRGQEKEFCLCNL